MLVDNLIPTRTTSLPVPANGIPHVLCQGQILARETGCISGRGVTRVDAVVHVGTGLYCVRLVCGAVVLCGATGLNTTKPTIMSGAEHALPFLRDLQTSLLSHRDLFEDAEYQLVEMALHLATQTTEAARQAADSYARREAVLLGVLARHPDLPLHAAPVMEKLRENQDLFHFMATGRSARAPSGVTPPAPPQPASAQATVPPQQSPTVQPVQPVQPAQATYTPQLPLPTMRAARERFQDRQQAGTPTQLAA